jgi:hypothetical protein
MKRLLEAEEFREATDNNRFFLKKTATEEIPVYNESFMLVKDKDKSGVYFEVYGNKIKYEEFFRFNGTWLKGNFQIYVLTEDEGIEYLKNIMAGIIQGDWDDIVSPKTNFVLEENGNGSWRFIDKCKK